MNERDRKQLLEHKATAEIFAVAQTLAMDSHRIKECLQHGENGLVHGVKLRADSIQRSLDSLRKYVTLLEVLKEL